MVTCVFIGLMIYRSVIGMREEDQLYLDSSVLASQQKEIVAKLDRIAPYTKGFGWASAGLLLLIAGFSMYQPCFLRTNHKQSRLPSRNLLGLCPFRARHGVFRLFLQLERRRKRLLLRDISKPRSETHRDSEKHVRHSLHGSTRGRQGYQGAVHRRKIKRLCIKTAAYHSSKASYSSASGPAAAAPARESGAAAEPWPRSAGSARA
jgi:hypothetical protein